MVPLALASCWVRPALADCALASWLFSAASSCASVVSLAVSMDRLSVSWAIWLRRMSMVLLLPESAEERNASASTKTSSTKMVTMSSVESAST
jgi:hypothetical protein